MSYIDTYKALIEKRGITGRDRQINILKRDFSRLAPDSPAYKKIVYDDIEQYVIIKSSDSYYTKEVICLPGEILPLGKIVKFANMSWLVNERDFDDEIYGKSKMRMCNTKLRWKDANGDIHEYEGWADDATKYSEGVEHTRYIRVGEFQLKVFVPANEFTATIWRDMRFLIDSEKYCSNIVDTDHYPFAFKVTRRNIVTGTYNDEGYVEITMVEDEFVVGEDDIENMIAAQTNDSGTTKEIVDEGGWL